MAAKNRVRQAKQSGAALAVASAAGQLPEEDAPPSSAVGCDESSAAKLGTAASWRRADGGYASTVASAGRDGERSAASPSPSAAEITTGSCGDDGGCPAPPRLSGEQCAPPAAAADSGAGAVAGVSGVDQPTPSSHSEAPRESGGRVLYSLQWAPPTSGEDRLGDTPTIDGQGAVGHLSGSRTAGDGGLQTQQAAAVANHQRKQEEEEGPATVLNQSQLSALLRSMAGAGRHSGDEMTGGVVVSRPHAGSDEGATSGGRWVGGESSATLEGGGQERAEPLRQAVAACNAVGSVARNFAKRAAAAHRQRDYAAALSFLTEVCPFCTAVNESAVCRLYHDPFFPEGVFCVRKSVDPSLPLLRFRRRSGKIRPTQYSTAIAAPLPTTWASLQRPWRTPAEPCGWRRRGRRASTGVGRHWRRLEGSRIVPCQRQAQFSISASDTAVPLVAVADDCVSLRRFFGRAAASPWWAMN